MKRNKIKIISVSVFLIIFAVLFSASTIIYFIDNGKNNEIDLEYSVNKFEDIQNLDKLIQDKLNVGSNDVFIFNGGDIEYNFGDNTLTKMCIELLVRYDQKYAHYQLQVENSKIVLKNFGSVIGDNIKALCTLNAILEPISHIKNGDDNAILKFSIDTAIFDNVQIEENNYVYIASDWENLLEPLDGKFIRIMSHQENEIVNTYDTKNYYIQYKEIYL
ncbi:MAG: hypothetical protein RSB61_04535 [Clostridia bacterium]